MDIGIEFKYDRKGRLTSATPYKNGKKHGIEKGYYENGNLEYEVTYRKVKRILELSKRANKKIQGQGI